MPLHYNLSKVYFLTERKPEVIQAMVVTFIEDSTIALKNIRKGIQKKNYEQVHNYASSLESTLELFGLDNAHDDVVRIIHWTENEGKKKEIKATFKEFKNLVKLAVKELKKDYKLSAIS